MGWTLDVVRDLPVHEYDFIVDEINRDAEKARR